MQQSAIYHNYCQISCYRIRFELVDVILHQMDIHMLHKDKEMQEKYR